MKPQIGLWRGSLFVKEQGIAVSVSIDIAEAEDDGTLSGRLEFPEQSKRWSAANDNQFVRGRYSPFGTLHLEQINSADGREARSTLTLDARFDAPDQANGALWGSVLITPPSSDGASDQTNYSGILVASHVGDDRLRQQPGVWVP